LRIWIILVLIGIFFLGTQYAYGQSLTFDSLINVSVSGADSSTRPQMLVSQNNVYLVWQETPPGMPTDVFFSISTDNGVTFSTPINLSNSAERSQVPQVGASGNNIHVVWEEELSPREEVFYARSTNNGVSFSTPENLSLNTNDESVDPQIVVSGSDVHVLWADFGEEIFYRKSVNDGALFASKIALTNGFKGKFDPHLEVTGSLVYASWRQTPDIKIVLDVFFARSIDGGLNFQTPIMVSDTTGGAAELQMSFAENSVYLIWREGDIMFSRSANNGVSFSTPENLSNSAESDRVPHVDATGSDVFTVWRQHPISASDNYFSSSINNGAFSTPINLSGSSTNVGQPQIDSFENKVVVTWTDTVPITFDLQPFVVLSTDKGATFGNAQGVNTNTASAADPVRVVFSQETFYFSWFQQDTGFNEVFFRKAVIDCAPPISGNWIITASCTMTGSETANGSVIIRNNAVLTVPNGFMLDINFASSNLTVESGSGVLIEAGGKIT